MSTTISNFCFVINSRFEWHVMLQHFEVFKLSKDITCENKKEGENMSWQRYVILVKFSDVLWSHKYFFAVQASI